MKIQKKKNKTSKSKVTKKSKNSNRLSKQKVLINSMTLQKISKNEKSEMLKKKKKKSCGNVENFPQQVKQGLYYICTICHGRLHQLSVRLFNYEKYNILIAVLNNPVKPFEEKLYVGKNVMS